jgi:hypothetical protein
MKEIKITGRFINVVIAIDLIVNTAFPGKEPEIIKEFGNNGLLKEGETPVMQMELEPPAMIRFFEKQALTKVITDRFYAGDLALYERGFQVSVERRNLVNVLDCEIDRQDFSRIAAAGPYFLKFTL